MRSGWSEGEGYAPPALRNLHPLQIAPSGTRATNSRNAGPFQSSPSGACATDPGAPPDMDVYDGAAWSEQPIADEQGEAGKGDHPLPLRPLTHPQPGRVRQ